MCEGFKLCGFCCVVLCDGVYVCFGLFEYYGGVVEVVCVVGV